MLLIVTYDLPLLSCDLGLKKIIKKYDQKIRLSSYIFFPMPDILKYNNGHIWQEIKPF